MSKPLTATDLIKSIKLRASVPINQSTFTVDDLLEFANEELQLGVVPKIMSVHEDHLLYEDEVSIESGRLDYEIPNRALGNKLRDVQMRVGPGVVREMTRIGIGERFDDAYSAVSTTLPQFYVKGNKVVLNSVNSASGYSLVFVYYIRPSTMVPEEEVGVVQDVVDNGDGTSRVALGQVPTAFTTSSIFDMYKGTSPCSILNKDLVPVSVDSVGKSVTFNTDDIPKELVAGDHLSLAGESNLPQIPIELHPMLAQMVACRVLEALGDTQGLQNALIKLKQMDTAAGMLIDNRIDDAPQKVVNRHSVLRTGTFSKRYNRR